MTGLLVNTENNAEIWWDAARDAIDQFPKSTQDFIKSNLTNEVIVSEEDADAFIGVAESLPGWDDGPEFAKEAILRHVDDD